MRTVMIIGALFGLSACDTMNGLVPGTTGAPMETVATTATGQPATKPLPSTPTAVPDPSHKVPAPTAVEEAPIESAMTLYTVASLGDPSKPGKWMETPLVETQQMATVTDPNTGKSTQVTLIPISGEDSAGSRLSMEGYRALGADLTTLVNLNVVPT